MNILITGVDGFFGKNLAAALRNIRDGKDTTHLGLSINNIYAYDKDSTIEELEYACKYADFIFNLVGVNRPKQNNEFMSGNLEFVNTLLDTLKKYNNRAPVMLSSSIQATLLGRYGESDYGKSKLAGEELLFKYGEEKGIKVLVYRFPNLFGKWTRPNYNSVVATFCNNIANDLPIQVNDSSESLELVYVDDAIAEMVAALQCNEHRCNYEGMRPVACVDGRYCFVPVTHKVTLGEIADLLYKFHDQSKTLLLPDIPNNSFEKKLYSMYISYLPKEKIAFPLKMNVDERGNFTELLKTANCGQFSVNISKPGITKGQHWHQSKWELFIVVSGHGLIQERRIGTDEIFEFEVSGDRINAVHMLPGYTHNIINLSETEDLVTLMWANEIFDPMHPDTFAEEV